MISEMSGDSRAVNHKFAVKMRGRPNGDEEVVPVRVGATVGHACKNDGVFRVLGFGTCVESERGRAFRHSEHN